MPSRSQSTPGWSTSKGINQRSRRAVADASLNFQIISSIMKWRFQRPPSTARGPQLRARDRVTCGQRRSYRLEWNRTRPTHVRHTRQPIVNRLRITALLPRFPFPFRFVSFCSPAIFVAATNRVFSSKHVGLVVRYTKQRMPERSRRIN